MMMIRFSVYDLWRVKLTEEGIMVLDADYAIFNAKMPGRNFDWRKVYKLDSDGRIELPGYLIMKYFAKHMGATDPIVIEKEVELIGPDPNDMSISRS